MLSICMKKGQWITCIDWLFLLFAILFVIYAVISQGPIILFYGIIGFILLSIVGWIIGDIAYKKGRASFKKEQRLKV